MVNIELCIFPYSINIGWIECLISCYVFNWLQKLITISWILDSVDYFDKTWPQNGIFNSRWFIYNLNIG